MKQVAATKGQSCDELSELLAPGASSSLRELARNFLKATRNEKTQACSSRCAIGAVESKRVGRNGNKFEVRIGLSSMSSDNILLPPSIELRGDLRRGLSLEKVHEATLASLRGRFTSPREFCAAAGSEVSGFAESIIGDLRDQRIGVRSARGIIWEIGSYPQEEKRTVVFNRRFSKKV